MDSKQWREIASEYIEGTLSADKAREVREFLAISPEARLDELALRGITQNLNDLPDIDPPLFFADNIIARIEREREEAQQKSWRSWLPNFGRLALGSLVAGGVMAGVAWQFFFPRANQVNQAGLVGGHTNSVQPTSAAPKPILKLSAVKVEEATLTFNLTLENAESAMVLASVSGGPTTGVSLGGTEPPIRPLKVPLDPAQDVQVVKLLSAAGGIKGEQWLITPLVNLQPASARLSFGMGELPLTPQALSELAKRFGQAITVVDVPQSERRIQFDARNETLEELLMRHLGPLGMTVTRVENRVVLSAK